MKGKEDDMLVWDNFICKLGQNTQHMNNNAINDTSSWVGCWELQNWLKFFITQAQADTTPDQATIGTEGTHSWHCWHLGSGTSLLPRRFWLTTGIRRILVNVGHISCFHPEPTTELLMFCCWPNAAWRTKRKARSFLNPLGLNTLSFLSLMVHTSASLWLNAPLLTLNLRFRVAQWFTNPFFCLVDNATEMQKDPFIRMII